MTEKQRANIFALVDSRTKVNNELAIQLAKGLGDDAFLKEVVWSICTPIAEDVYINIRKYSIVHKINYLDVCWGLIWEIRDKTPSPCLAEQCIAEYLENAARTGYAPILGDMYSYEDHWELPIV